MKFTRSLLLPVFIFLVLTVAAQQPRSIWSSEKANTWYASQPCMNTMRVFLHDLLYAQDAAGFKKRIDIFLRIARRYGIRPLLVFFDSCWNPFPHPGKQHEPGPFLHNSGWVQSADALKDTTQYKRLEKYVKDIVSHFKNDNRILGWDVWNEPDNTNGNSYNRFEHIIKLPSYYHC
jgi:endo-1,4-beta-mannosidase